MGVCLIGGLLWGTAKGQVSVVTGGYTQDFGTTDITSWTNNSTFPGWYAVRHLTAFSGAIPHEDITGAIPSNTGNLYTYECNGNNDQKLGARPSNSIPGAVGRYIRFGVVLRNMTGGTISSVRVQYTGFQLSLAENDGVINSLDFHYAVAAGIPSMTIAGTAVPALDYIAPIDDVGGNSNQLAGYPCTVYQTLTACIPVTIPNGSYILLRWSHQNSANNDHHLAIDDVVVDFGISGSNDCLILLPITLLQFTAVPQGSSVRLDWTTASEQGNAYFTVERSDDGQRFEPILVVPGAGNSHQLLDYMELDRAPLFGLSYYRLRQTDVSGETTVSNVVTVMRRNGSGQPLVAYRDADQVVALHDLPAGSRYELLDMVGRKIAEGVVLDETRSVIDARNLQHGAYLLRMTDGARVESVRFVY